MRIGELSKATGIAVETIRHYEREGLLAPPARLGNNYRSYGDAHFARLRFIAHCRKLDMALSDIRQIIDYDGTDPEEASRVHALLLKQIEDVDSHIRALSELRGKLLELERSCHGHGKGRVCGIITELSSPGDWHTVP